MDCSVAQTLDLVGDWWTLLIVREAMFGSRRFGDFEKNLGIAKNILASRLKDLVENQILEKDDSDPTSARASYRLTERGKDLGNVLNALREWGDKWVFGSGNEPLVVVDRKTGKPAKGLAMLNADGKPMGPRDIGMLPGKNAPEAVKQRFATEFEKRKTH